jgi:hypothetical protein
VSGGEATLGGHRFADCKLLGVEPHAYLADAISRISNRHPQAGSTISCHGSTR